MGLGVCQSFVAPAHHCQGSPRGPTTAPPKLFPGVSSPALSDGSHSDRHAQSSQEFCTLILHLVFLHSDEMIYDSVENGDEGEPQHSLEYGWSSSEFELHSERLGEQERSPAPSCAATTGSRQVSRLCAGGQACSHGACGQDREGCLIHVVFT